MESQAVNRAHRFGRELPLLVYRFVIESSVERRIVDLLHQKMDTFEHHVEGAKEDSLPTENLLKQILEMEN